MNKITGVEANKCNMNYQRLTRVNKCGTLKRMKTGKAVGPDDIMVEV